MSIGWDTIIYSAGSQLDHQNWFSFVVSYFVCVELDINVLSLVEEKMMVTLVELMIKQSRLWNDHNKHVPKFETKERNRVGSVVI